uniref:Uncharacterized protein n=1 Tax=Angiostrongylus cantonensis TaxID=6313 RepID=A0A0K0CYX7_ANGCA
MGNAFFFQRKRKFFRVFFQYPEFCFYCFSLFGRWYYNYFAKLLLSRFISKQLSFQPTTCKFCQLPAAFHEEKCVYCSHSERKFGAPIPCANCKLRAFWRHHHVTRCSRANKQTNLAGVAISSHDHYSGHKRRREEKKKVRLFFFTEINS